MIHLGERSSYRRTLRCIVFFSSGRTHKFEEAHTLEFCWYQPNVEVLAKKTFCLWTRTKDSVSKIVFCHGLEYFVKKVFTPQYFTFTIHNSEIVVSYWFTFPNILCSKASHPSPMVFNDKELHSYLTGRVVWTTKSICIKKVETTEPLLWLKNTENVIRLLKHLRIINVPTEGHVNSNTWCPAFNSFYTAAKCKNELQCSRKTGAEVRPSSHLFFSYSKILVKCFHLNRSSHSYSRRLFKGLMVLDHIKRKRLFQSHFSQAYRTKQAAERRRLVSIV